MSRTPLGVLTARSTTGAPSAGAGSVAWNFCASVATLLRSIDFSTVLLPLCAESPLNCSQSYADAAVAGRGEHHSDAPSLAAHRACDVTGHRTPFVTSAPMTIA
jgi:hypothetical protein